VVSMRTNSCSQAMAGPRARHRRPAARRKQQARQGQTNRSRVWAVNMRSIGPSSVFSQAIDDSPIPKTGLSGAPLGAS
jgi:hypothetical protein